MAASKKTASKKTATKKTAAVNKTASKKLATSKKAPTKSSASKTQRATTTTPAKTATAKEVAKPAMAKQTATKHTSTKQPATKKPAAEQPAAKQTVPKKSAAQTSTNRSVPTANAKKPKRVLSPLLSNDVPEVHEIPPPRGTTKDGIKYTKDFDVKFLVAQREELEARRASEVKRATRLEDEAESLIEGGEMGDVQFDDEGGEGDTMVVQRDLDRLLSSQARQTVGEIDLALERIKAGTYGYSEVSGLPIPRERLEALPETTVLAVEKVSGAGVR
jgi:RNA polymerase-binding transcription factor DksA